MDRVRSVKPSEFNPVDGAVIAVDFETYYAAGYSVDELGTWAYCQDPRFVAWCVAVTDGVTCCVCKPADFPWGRIDGFDWVSHNRDFDRTVWERLKAEGGRMNLGEGARSGDSRESSESREANVYGAGPKEWWCSAAACAFLQYPRDLAGACLEVLGRAVDKSVRKASRDVRGADAARGQGTLFEMDLCEDESAYGAADAVNCWDLWAAVGGKWPAHERRLFDMTSRMARRGLYIDRDSVIEKAAELTARREELAAGIPWTPALSSPKFDAACLAAGLTPPKSKAAGDEGYMAWAEEHDGTLPAKWAADMAMIRRSGRLAKVLGAMASRGMQTGRMAYDLKYFGTSPGGWSGAGGLNVQNFNRKEAAGVDVRKCIMAPPGYVLAVADYSQIQARILLYLAGDVASLDLLREKPDMDMYEVHARRTMGWRPLRGAGVADDAAVRCSGKRGDADELFHGLRPPPEYRLKNLSPPCPVCTSLSEGGSDSATPVPASLLKVGLTPGQGEGDSTPNAEGEREESLQDYCERTGSGIRQLAKARTLGLGFQCAAETFIGTARRMAGLKLGITDARTIVREYRESNPKIVHLWARLEAEAAAHLGGDYHLALPCTINDSRCRRELIYREIYKAGRGFECTVCGERVPLHGGILTQNWVYGTARDVLASAWLRCVAQGYEPVLCVHDELVFEVPEATARVDLARIVAIMEEPVPWAAGLPLRVGGKLMSRYGK